MAIWKHYIVLFGGFYDPGIRSMYFYYCSLNSYLYKMDFSELFKRSLDF